MNRVKALEVLGEIGKLAQRIDKLNEAEERLNSFMDSLNPVNFELIKPDIVNLINSNGSITKGRRKRLLARVNRITPEDGPDRRELPDIDTGRVERQSAALRRDLKELSENHIFQWSTYYRDLIVRVFEEALGQAEGVKDATSLYQAIAGEFAVHSEEIFIKGYEHVTSSLRLRQTAALTKASGGLQRFLELPIDVYGTEAQRARAGARSRAIRATCSCILEGILLGFTRVDFGRKNGSAVLPNYTRSWAHFLAFLQAPAVQRLEAALAPGPMREGLQHIVAPTAAALDRLSGVNIEGRFALPGLGEFVWEPRRLDISLLPPPWVDTKGFIEIQCYIDPTFVNRGVLEQAISRGVDVIVASLKPDLHEWALSNDILRPRLVQAETQGDNQTVYDQVLNLLTFCVSREKAEVDAEAPLTYNFARNFPLQNPFLAKYFHVHRPSIRLLLQGSERTNGSRLWCSVRRSGKTTACFDLGGSTQGSVVVSQTCDHTDQYPDADVFFRRFLSAITERQQIPPDFFSRSVEEAAGEAGESANRFVFVLDEYETLFERMSVMGRADPELRFAVFQPLLNQMVGFSRENLIVLIGQRPDAHFVFMEQNQLSAYVEQDPFPLFRFDQEDDGSEFLELVRKVLTDRVSFDNSFAAAVYDEAAGHPYLTVKLLVSFYDWLIERKWQISRLSFDASTYQEFAEDRLSPGHLGADREFVFFTHAAGEAMSDEGRQHTPWLHCVYRMLTVLARQPQQKMTVEAFGERSREAGLEGILQKNTDYLLSSGALANFFRVRDGRVTPRIPLLARIAATTAPRINP